MPIAKLHLMLVPEESGNEQPRSHLIEVSKELITDISATVATYSPEIELQLHTFYLNDKELSRYLGLEQSTLQKWRSLGQPSTSPKLNPSKFGGAVRYSIQGVFRYEVDCSTE